MQYKIPLHKSYVQHFGFDHTNLKKKNNSKEILNSHVHTCRAELRVNEKYAIYKNPQFLRNNYETWSK